MNKTQNINIFEIKNCFIVREINEEGDNFVARILFYSYIQALLRIIPTAIPSISTFSWLRSTTIGESSLFSGCR